MSLDTYADLKATIIEWLDRDDLSETVDTLIDLAEDKFRRNIRLNSTLVRGTLTLLQGNHTVSAPGDLLDIKHLRLQVPGTQLGRRYMPSFSQVTWEQLMTHSVLEEGTPAYWVLEGSEFEFDRPADQDYTMDAMYYREMTPLSDTTQTNELLSEHPSAYLYASLLESAPFLIHDERVATWGALYQQIEDGIRISELKNKKGGPLVARVKGVPQTVVR